MDLNALLSLGRGASLEYDQNETFIDAFQRQVGKTPDATAVVDESGSITYRELDIRSDAIAAELPDMGVEAGDFVAIKLPRVKEFLVAVIGIWKAGCAYMPVDPAYPEKRIRYMMEDSGAKLTIDESWMERLRNTGGSSIPVNKAYPGGIAIIIYTSGSTGCPKGVMSTHAGVRAMCYGMTVMYDYHPEYKVAQIASFSFVISCADLFPPLSFGIPVHIISLSMSKDIPSLDRYIRENGISIVTIVPQIGLTLVNSFHTPLKVVGMGGAKVCSSGGSGTRLNSVYGLTELCGGVSYVDLSGTAGGDTPLLGRPLPGVTIVLEDESGNPVPQGEVGEVCIASPQVAAGYWHNPELTAKVFVDREWSGYKVVRSGDLARWNDDGILEFHGRKDDMVKIRGNRVELDEVGSVLLKIDGVRAAAVAMKEMGGEPLLCGYYVSAEPFPEESLRTSMSELLPQYMVPSFFVRMDALPKLPNGKLDRLSLPVPVPAGSEYIVAPETEFEKRVYPVVVREMEGIAFGVTSNLISLGFTSLRAIRLSATLKTELGIDIPQSEMLAHPSIREWEPLSGKETDVIPVGPLREWYPLTDNQMGLYVEWEQNREATQYNLPFVLKLDGGDAQKLYDALRGTMELHPILKMHLAERDGNIVQLRRDDAELEVGFEKLDFEPDDDFFRKLVLPFDLLGEDLCRFTVYSSERAAWLFSDVHHIIFDGGSVNLFLHTLSSLYRGVSPEAEPVTAYDYALYREQWKETAEFGEYGRYFGTLLEDTESFTYPSPAGGTVNGRLGTVTTDIPRRKIQEFCHSCSVTENSFFATVLTQVFHRISREKCIQMAMFSSGRSMTQLTGSIGMFVQTLPLVSRITGGTVGDALKNIHSRILETLSRDRYPYTSLSQHYGVKPDVMYVYQGDLIDDPDFGSVQAECHQIPVTSAISPLTVEISPDADVYRIRFGYDCGMYREQDIDILARAVAAFSDGMAGSTSDTPLNSLAMVSDQEKMSLLSIGTGENLDYDRNETFIDMFLGSVAAVPESVAVVDHRSRLTYRELDGLSDALAAELLRGGVYPGDFVAVRMPRVKEFVVAVLGIWKAGGAYVPIDPEYPEERINYMLEDSGAKVVIDPAYFENIAGGNKEHLNSARPENPAYMIYTSGSTGKPKGVVVTHANLRAFMAWLPAELGLKRGEAVAQHASFSFDASVCDLYSSLASGATLHILSSELRKELDSLAKYIEDEHIVGSTLSTQLGMELLNAKDLKMRYMVLGGEKLKQVRRSGVRLINGYGPTEFTVWSSHHIVDQTKDGENIPIGRPVPNSVSLIVDASGNVAPLGVAGELCLSGAQLSNGYWHRPELTGKVFVPCRALGGAKMYRTGDLVRWNGNGELEYLGRIDNQVKLRGFRIEMGEIEAALSKFTGITSAVAEVKTVSGIQHLCAYYVSDTEIDTSALRTELSRSLTEYMIPDAYIRLESLPHTPNGKVDRKALPLPELKADEIVAPQTERERGLYAIACEVLGTDRFGVTTNLMSMGLTSIGAIRLSMVIKKRLGLNISTGDILSSPRIRDWKDGSSDRIEVSEPRTYYPLTDNQLGIYIDWNQNRGGLQYNVPAALKFADVDPKRLVAAIREVISVHPSFKTRIVQIEGELLQHRRDGEQLDIFFEHLDFEPSAEFFQSRVRPFNLLEDDLARFEVYSYGTAAYLFYDIHHIIFDGGSANVLLSDLAEIFSDRVPAPEAVSSFDYSLYYDEWKKSEKYGEYEEYFDSLVSGTASFRYPSGVGSMSSTGKSASVTVSIPADDIRSYCRRLGITENAYFATVLTQVFHRISREETVQITTISNGRSMEQLAETTGMFVQTLPLVSRRSRGASSDILRDMQNQVAETVRRDKYPFTRLSERHPVKPDVIYVYQGDVMNNDALSGSLKTESISLALDTVKTPLSVVVFPEDGKYSIILEYDAGMYPEGDMELLGKALSVFAVSLSEHPFDDDITVIGLTDQAEETELIRLGTGEKLDYDRNETVVDMFLRNVSAVPESAAVADYHSNFTYGELDAVSDAVAAKLASEGVGAGDFVAVRMPRVKEFVVAVLGIWKAGGAYVPVDPEYPEERINYMLEDSGAKVVIDPAYFENIAVGNTHVNFSRPENPAYMIYTSGSTGKPKGVMVRHSNLRAFAQFRLFLTEAERGDAFAHYTSFSFDASLDDIVTSLSCGGCLHILSESLRKDMAGMADYFAENRIVGLTLPTQLGMEMLNSYPDMSLRYVMLGGEKLKAVGKTNVRIINGYGPTEFTVCAMYHIVDQAKDGDNIPIGRPVPNTICLIVDVFGNVLPRGLVGELCLSGVQLSGGYWHRPEQTAKVFVPCRALGGAEIYRTGDMARWNENGELEYMGRIDNQVKLRGFRIEMGEIESTMSSFDGITASVAKICSISGTEHLCAYYTAKGDIDEAALKAHISSRLTSYMVPDAIMRLDSLPLTPNGKVDSAKLPVPDMSSGGKTAAFQAPEGEIEQDIAQAFSKALGSDSPVSRDDSFFSVGGTSLLVMKVIVSLADKGYRLTYSDVFKFQTPRALAAFIEGCRTVSHASEDRVPAPVDSLDAQKTPDTGEDGYDYTGINHILESNRLQTVKNISGLDASSIGDVLLLGATGYLGIHILKSLLTDYGGKIYCVIRPRKDIILATRLKSYLMYYFGRTFSGMFRRRLTVIEGDLMDDALMDRLLEIKVDTVINCAANVKHFAAGDEISRINLDGTLRLIDYCRRTGSRLIQTSTHSISGQMEGTAPVTFTESDLYIGQKLMTKYQISKFMAERAVLQACTEGLNAKIMRLGNLMPRFSDGEFQMNIENNGFMGRMRAYYFIGCIAASHLHMPLEFAPIDATAGAILTLARTPDRYTVFHPYNNHTIYIADVVAAMKQCGLEIRIVDDDVFNDSLHSCLEDDRLNPYITPLLAYSSHSDYTVNPPSQDFTIHMLNVMDWRWPVTGTQYLMNALEKMKSLGYFDKF